MSGNDDKQKTEEPTYKKLRDARKEGNVAQSKDLTMVFSISTCLFILFIFRGFISQTLELNYFTVFSYISTKNLENFQLHSIVWQLLTNIIKIIIMIIGVTVFVGLIVAVIQLGGFLLTNKLSKFDFQKFNVVNNFKQIFSKKNFIKFAFNCTKISIFSLVGFYMLSNMIVDIVLLPEVSIFGAVSFLVGRLFKVLVVLLFIYFIFALFDFVVEKRAMHKQLMMTREEVEREYKESEGSPEIKHKRRELQQELLQEDEMWQLNKDFMFVLANPTHIAVLLLYSPKKYKLPVVILIKKGNAALAVFNTAKKYKVNIFRDKYLARKLYKLAEEKKFIPKTTIADVAELIGKNIHLLPKIAKEMAEVKLAKSQANQSLDKLFNL